MTEHPPWAGPPTPPPDDEAGTPTPAPRHPSTSGRPPRLVAAPRPRPRHRLRLRPLPARGRRRRPRPRRRLRLLRLLARSRCTSSGRGRRRRHRPRRGSRRRPASGRRRSAVLPPVPARLASGRSRRVRAAARSVALAAPPDRSRRLMVGLGVLAVILLIGAAVSFVATEARGTALPQGLGRPDPADRALRRAAARSDLQAPGRGRLPVAQGLREDGRPRRRDRRSAKEKAQLDDQTASFRAIGLLEGNVDLFKQENGLSAKRHPRLLLLRRQEGAGEGDRPHAGRAGDARPRADPCPAGPVLRPQAPRQAARRRPGRVPRGGRGRRGRRCRTRTSTRCRRPISSRTTRPRARARRAPTPRSRPCWWPTSRPPTSSGPPSCRRSRPGVATKRSIRRSRTRRPTRPP